MTEDGVQQSDRGDQESRDDRRHAEAQVGDQVDEASECRGLEFDSVIVVLPNEIVTARPGGERDLYVALTRATKRLRTIGIRTA